MKAAVVLALATTAAAAPITGCQIPDTYVSSNGNTCTGVNPGYNVFGFCVTGADRTVLGLTDATQVRASLAASPNSFSAGTSTAVGCRIPSIADAWNVAGVNQEGLTADATRCTGLAAATALSATASVVKGVEIRCDAANGYFPTQGFEGSAVCLDGAGTDVISVANPANNNDYFASGLFQPFDFTRTGSAIGAAGMQTEFVGGNRLICARGCVLPTTICANGRLNANIAGSGTGFNEGTCTLRPTRLGLFETNFQFRCNSARSFGNTFTASCSAASTAPVITGFTNELCGSIDGAQSPPLFNFDNRLDEWATARVQAAGELHDMEFELVTSTVFQAFLVNAGAYATVMMHRGWNQNPVANLRNGAVYQITVNGCDAFVGDARRRCVQHALNFWRCEIDFPFFGGTICFADRAEIACPTHELGFRCPSSSKKGLWGLLGLLGIIPVLLICCSLLLLCCIRRRKTEADVHFATFDGHAAPVVATAPVATTCNGFTGTPFTHPSAVPVM